MNENKKSLKTLNVYEDVKEKIQNLKNELKLKNDSDTIKFLLDVYKESREIPKNAFKSYLELKK